MITIQEETTKTPISLIGKEAGVCYGANTADAAKNYKRGMNCIKANHGRTLEFPDVYFILDGYSARVIREFYTHIGGAPTRLQASTRYIDYTNFKYITPPKILQNITAQNKYHETMLKIIEAIEEIQSYGIPKEDAAMLLPLGMETTVVCKMNLRTMIAMMNQRLCTRAYWEFRNLCCDLAEALEKYSDEWTEIVKMLFKPKCDAYGFCPEERSCGRRPKKED